MEHLPLEMVEAISCHLVLEDIAACCEVSRGWRSAFNHDSIWFPHVKGVVQSNGIPLEQQTQQCDRSLDPACPVRQQINLLVNNWRQTKFVRSKTIINHNSLKTNTQIAFITDDIIVIAFVDCVEIWNVNANQPSKVAESSYFSNLAKDILWIGCSSHSPFCYFFAVALTNKSDEKFVNVFHLDITLMSLKLKHIFTDEDMLETIKCSTFQSSFYESTEIFFHSLNFCNDFNIGFVIMEHFLLGSYDEFHDVLQAGLDIYDLKSGEKRRKTLKLCDSLNKIELDFDPDIKLSQHSACKDILFILRFDMFWHYFVFSLDMLDFLEFTKSKESFNLNPDWEQSAIIENYVIIGYVCRFKGDCTQIYNYKNSELINVLLNDGMSILRGIILNRFEINSFYLSKELINEEIWSSFVTFNEKDREDFKNFVGLYRSMKSELFFKHVLWKNLTSGAKQTFKRVCREFGMNKISQIGARIIKIDRDKYLLETIHFL